MTPDQIEDRKRRAAEREWDDLCGCFEIMYSAGKVEGFRAYLAKIWPDETPESIDEMVTIMTTSYERHLNSQTRH